MGWIRTSSLALACVCLTGLALAGEQDAERTTLRKSATADSTDVVDAARRTVRQRSRRAAPRDLNEALRRLQATRVSVEFEEAELKEVVAFIQKVTDFNVIIGPALLKDGLDDVGRVTLSLDDVSTKQLCELVAKVTGTKLLFNKSKILEFTTPTAARGKPVLRIYSIGEIVAPITHFPGPDINLRPSGAEFEDEQQSVTESPFGDADGLAALIQDMIESETWEDDDVSISGNGTKLIVRQYPHVHRKIRRLLAQLRAAR